MVRNREVDGGPKGAGEEKWSGWNARRQADVKLGDMRSDIKICLVFSEQWGRQLREFSDWRGERRGVGEVGVEDKEYRESYGITKFKVNGLEESWIENSLAAKAREGGNGSSITFF